MDSRLYLTLLRLLFRATHPMHHGNYHKLTLAGMLKLRSLMHAKKLPLNSKGNAKLIPQGLGKL